MNMPKYILEELVDKEISIFFDGGDDITGTLKQISLNAGNGQLAGSNRDHLILSANDGKKAIAYLDTVTMILEGPVHW